VQDVQQRDSNEFLLFKAALISRMIFTKSAGTRKKNQQDPNESNDLVIFNRAGVLRGSLYRSSVSSS
jgi:hypothetical protein